MKTALFVTAAAMMAAKAHAGPISPSAAEDVIESYGATLTSSAAAGDSAHTIDAKLGDLNMTVRLGGCDETLTCQYAMMFATFDLGAPADEQTLIKTNSYNDSYPFGRAFIIPSQDGQSDAVGIDYVVDLSNETEFDPGDISRFQEILNSYIAHWTSDGG